MTLYAAMLELGRRDMQALRITDRYSLHRVVYSLYDDVRSTEQKKRGSAPSGILFDDLGGNVRARRILTMANRMPTLEHIEAPIRMTVKKVPQEFLGHDQYRFRVRVNPVHRGRGGAMPVLEGDDAIQWFRSSAVQSWGFRLLTLQDLLGPTVVTFTAQEGNVVTLNEIVISGVLKVTNRERFQQNFQQGIGRGKAFGFGLLHLVPVSSR